MAGPPGVWGRARVFCYMDQKEFSNEYYYTVSAGGPIPVTWDPYAAATAFNSAIAVPLRVLMGSNVGTVGTQFTYNDGTGSSATDYYSKVASVSSSLAIPEDASVVVQKKTGNHTRGGSGRWYFSGVDRVNVGGSYLTTSGVNAWQAFAVALKTAVVDQGITWSPAHFSKKLGLLLPIINTPVISLLGTRRRRRFIF
jgi:hypothetical protein